MHVLQLVCVCSDNYIIAFPTKVHTHTRMYSRFRLRKGQQSPAEIWTRGGKLNERICWDFPNIFPILRFGNPCSYFAIIEFKSTRKHTEIFRLLCFRSCGFHFISFTTYFQGSFIFIELLFPLQFFLHLCCTAFIAFIYDLGEHYFYFFLSVIFRKSFCIR